MRTTVTKIFRTLAVLAFLTLNHQRSTVFAQEAIYYFPEYGATYRAYFGLTLGPDGNFYGIEIPVFSSSASNTVVYEVTTNGTFTAVHAFTAPVSNGQGISTNADGASPTGVFVPGSDGYLYGTTSGGGANGDGTLFRMANATFATVVSFGNTNEEEIENVTLGADGYFYGTIYNGGSGDGSFLRMATNGAYAQLASFGGANGSGPQCLTLGRDGSFYGTTSTGGINGDGTMFRVTTNFDTLTTIISYGGTNGEAPGNLTLGADGNFYGFNEWGGTNSNGSLYRVTTNGVLTTFYSFSPLVLDTFLLNPIFTNSDGAFPNGLILGPDGNLYGTTVSGGSIAGGTTFQVTRNGTVIPLTSFFPDYGPGGGVPGVNPNGGLTLGPDGHFYGTTSDGSLYGVENGTIYRFTPPLPEPNIYGIYGNPSASSTTLLLASLPGTTNILYGTTNLTLPLGQWHSLATNAAPTTGFFQYLDSTTKGVPAKFYTLKLTR